MGKPYSDSKSDILQEEYKGAGPVVTSAGYVSLTHLASTIGGFILFGAIGALVSGKTMEIKEVFTDFSATNKASGNPFKSIPAHVAGWVPKVADSISSKVMSGAKKVTRGKTKTPVASEGTSAFMFAGGIGGAAGWIGSTIWGIAKGSHQGSVGKHQFSRAKHEISNLREDNADLNKINDELHAKYVKAATRLDTIQAAQDAARSELPMDTQAPTTGPTTTPTNEVQLAQAQHHGTSSLPEIANIVA